MPNVYTPTPVANIIRDYVRSMKALILNKDFTIKIWPNSNDREDIEAAEMGENFLRHIESADDEIQKDELEKIAIWTVIAGVAFDRTFPEMENDSWVFDASGNPITTGNIVSESVSPFNFVCDAMGDRLAKKRYIGIKSLKEKEWVEDTFHVKLAADSKELGHIIDYERRLSQMVASVSPWKGDGIEIPQDYDEDNEMVLVKEVEFKPTKENPKGHYAGMVGDEIIFQYNRLPIPVDKDNGHWEYSITDFHYHYVAGRFWSDAGVNDLISPQNSINEIDQDLAVNRKGPGRPIVVVSTDMNLKRLTKFGQSVTVLQYDPFLSGGQRPVISRGQALPSQVLEERGIHHLTAQDAAGDPRNVLRGKAPTTHASGVMVDILRDTAEAGHLPDVTRFYRSVKRIKRKQLLLAQEVYSEERMIKIPEKRNRVKVLAFKGADLRNNTDVHFELASGVASTQAGKTEILMKLTEAGFFNADNQLDPEYRIELLRRMGLSGFEDPRNVDIERAESENEIMAHAVDQKNIDVAKVDIDPSDDDPATTISVPVIRGIFQSIGPTQQDGEGQILSDDALFQFDDHGVHYESHRRFILSSEFRYLHPAVQEAAIAHAQVHKQMIELQAMEAQQKMAEAQGQAEATVRASAGIPGTVEEMAQP
jgi:hypothetical protein